MVFFHWMRNRILFENETLQKTTKKNFIFIVKNNLKYVILVKVVRNYICGCGGMADALDSGSSGGNPVEVQVLSSALYPSGSSSAW